MTSKTLESPEEWGPSQTATIQHAFQLLKDNLRPEECDKASPTYRLGWYEHIQANRLRRADLETFRRFVGEMAERALRRSEELRVGKEGVSTCRSRGTPKP